MNLRLERCRHTCSGSRKNVGGFLLGDGNECLHDAGVKLGSTAAEQTRNRFRVRKTLPVAAIRDHRVEGIDHANDSRNHGNVVPFQSRWIASSVDALMMV